MGAHAWDGGNCWCGVVHTDENPPPRETCGNPACGCSPAPRES